MQRVFYLVLFIGLVGSIAYLLIRNKQILEEASQEAAATTSFMPAVEIIRPQRSTFSTSIQSSGNLLPKQELILMATTQGEVERTFVKRGDVVQKGQKLAKVKDDYLTTELRAVQANYDKSQKDVERFSKLLEGDAVTQQQFEQVQLGFEAAAAKLEGLQQRIEDTEIIAPISGILHEWYTEAGSTIGPGVRIGEIVNVSQLKLSVKIPEQDMFVVTEANQAKVYINSLPDASFTGIISYVGVKPDRDQLYEVVLSIHNDQRKPLRAGMFATVHFSSSQEQEGLTIPRKAIVGSLEEAQVYLIRKNSAVLTDITLGKLLDERVEVTSILTEQDSVVIRGQINLQDGIKVHVLPHDQ